MKQNKYSDIRGFLRSTYFKPDIESKNRLLAKLGIENSAQAEELRFIAWFKFAVAAAIILVSVSSLISANRNYPERFSGENLAAVSEFINDASLFEMLITGTEY